LIFVNGITLILEVFLTQGRAYGVAGIMYVDYVGIGILLTLISLILTKNRKILNLSFLVILLLFSILTQTRNIYVTLFITIFILFIYLIKNSKEFEIKRSSLIILIAVFITVFIISFVVVNQVSPEFTERFTRIGKVEQVLDKEGRLQSTLFTRVLIWSTSINAFNAHPIIGIGAFAFPFSSYQYYTIPDYLFETYVKGLSPHQGYLAVLTETGIIGFIGFLIFIYFIFKVSKNNLRLAKTGEEKYRAVSLLFLLVYIAVSLLMTDAWLWGQGAILWGLVLGWNLAYRRNLIEKYSYQE
jgi:O-antigen ligase